MSWMNALGGLLSQLGGNQPTPEQAEDHFSQIAGSVPTDILGGGLADAFRSNDTPPFAQMAGQLFGASGGVQKAGMLNTMLAAAGPAILSGAAGKILGQFLGGGKREITPEEAEQIPPEVVQQVAEHAEKRDPSIVDQVGNFYAQHPTLVKTLGGAVLAVALAKLSERQQG